MRKGSKCAPAPSIIISSAFSWDMAFGGRTETKVSYSSEWLSACRKAGTISGKSVEVALSISFFMVRDNDAVCLFEQRGRFAIVSDGVFDDRGANCCMCFHLVELLVGQFLRFKKNGVDTKIFSMSCSRATSMMPFFFSEERQ